MGVNPGNLQIMMCSVCRSSRSTAKVQQLFKFDSKYILSSSKYYGVPVYNPLTCEIRIQFSAKTVASSALPENEKF